MTHLVLNEISGEEDHNYGSKKEHCNHQLPSTKNSKHSRNNCLDEDELDCDEQLASTSNNSTLEDNTSCDPQL